MGLYPARMKEVSILVHEYYVDSLVAALHESGLIEITDLQKSDYEFKTLLEQSTIPAEAGTCAEYELRIGRVIDVLRRTDPPPRSTVQRLLFPYVPPKHIVEPRALSDLFADAEETLKSVEGEADRIESELNSIHERLETLRLREAQMDALMPLEFDLKDLGESAHILIKAGRVDDIELLRSSLQEVEGATLLSAPIPAPAEETARKRLRGKPYPRGHAAIIIVHRAQKEILASKLRGRVFTEFDLSGLAGTPGEVKAQLREERNALLEREKTLMDKLRQLNREWREKLIILSEELAIERSRKEVLARFGKTGRTKIITGWVLAKDTDSVRELCEHTTAGHVICDFRDPITNPDGVPIRLDNPRWAQPFEPITKMFAPPKYNEIDPTIFIALPFVLFFGIMLGDAGYGLLILAFSIFGYIRLGKFSTTARIMAYIGILVAIATIFFGILMGAFFGDFIPRFMGWEKLYDITILGFNLPYDSIRQPVLLLQVALILALTHLNLGLCLGAYQNIKSKKYKEFASDQVSWFIIQPAGGALIGEYMLHLWTLSDTAFSFACLGVVVGIALLIMNYKMLFFFEITGFLGDWLSYARLLALGLATAGLALTINLLAEMMFNPPPSPLCPATYIILTLLGLLLMVRAARARFRTPVMKLFAIGGVAFVIMGIAALGGIAAPLLITLGVLILLVAHFFNFLLQSLGAGIHSLRLQFVELFGRFYEGGGKEYSPFAAERLRTALATNPEKS